MSSFFTVQTVHRCHCNNKKKVTLDIKKLIGSRYILKSFSESRFDLEIQTFTQRGIAIFFGSPVLQKFLSIVLCNISLGPWSTAPSPTWSSIHEYPQQCRFHMTLLSMCVQLDIVWSLEVTTEGFRYHCVLHVSSLSVMYRLATVLISVLINALMRPLLSFR